MGFTHKKISVDQQSTRIHKKLIDTIGKLYVLTCSPSLSQGQKARKLSSFTGLNLGRCKQFVKEVDELERLVVKIIRQEAWEIRPEVEEGYMDDEGLWVVTKEAVEGVHTPEVFNISELKYWVLYITMRDYNMLFTNNGQLDPVYDIQNLSELQPAIELATDLIIKTYTSSGKQESFNVVTQEDFEDYKLNHKIV